MRTSFRELVKKIIRVLQFLLFLLKKPFLKAEELPDEDEAEQILMQYSADPGSSPICENIITESQYDLAIIVPAYNVEQYIQQCIESVLSQETQYKYRLIVINDGSTDKTASYLKAYDADERVCVIHQENRGFSGARNRGLELIESRYIMFLDSDDMLADDAIQVLMTAAETTKADIVQGGYQLVADKTLRVLNTKSYHDREMVQPIGLLTGMPWGKIYKSHLFKNIQFPAGYWYEDSILTSLVYPQAQKVGTVSALVYKYRVRASGITQSSSGKPKSIDTFWVTRCMLKTRNELCLETDEIYYNALLRQIVLNYKRTEKEPEDVKKSIFALSCKHFITQRESGFAVKDKRLCQLEKALIEKNYNQYKALCGLD